MVKDSSMLICLLRVIVSFAFVLSVLNRESHDVYGENVSYGSVLPSAFTPRILNACSLCPILK